MDTITDDYFWMKDKTNAEVIKHLEAENAYTAAVMKRPSRCKRRCIRSTSAAPSRPI